MKYTITLEVTTNGDIQGAKENIAMYLEKLGGVKVTSITKERDYEQTSISRG